MATKPEPGAPFFAKISGDLYEEYTIVEVRQVGDEYECILEDSHGERRTVMASSIERMN